MSLDLGIGCFHFRYDQPESGGAFTIDAYLSAVKNALESSPTISAVKIERGLWDASVSWSAGQTKTFNRDGVMVPDLRASGMRIEFKVRVPARLHAKLLGYDFLVDGIGCEDFLVRTRYDYHGPSTLIVSDRPVAGGSQAVVLVREHILEEFKARPSQVSLEILGPSPFHADVELAEGDPAQSTRFTYTRARQRGYDTFQILYDPNIWSSDSDAVRPFHDHVSDELSAFYGLQRQHRGRWTSWRAVEEKVSTLRESLTNPDRKRRDLFKDNTTSTQTLVALVDFEVDEVFLHASQREILGDVYHTGELALIEEDTRSLVDERFEMPTDQVRDIVRLTDSRFDRSISALAVLASGFVGGLAGVEISLVLR